MTRVDTIESQKVWSEIKEFENSINWNGNEFIGNLNDVAFFITPSMSTRSIYIKKGTFSKEMNDKVEIRISDHISSLKYEQKDLNYSFENFNIQDIKNIYFNKLKN